MNRMESFELLGECVPNMMIWLENPFRAMWVGTHYFKTVTPWSIVFYVLTGTLINLVPTPLLRHVMWKKHINSTKAAVFHVSTCDISESHLARPSVLTLTVAAVHIWAEKQRGNIRFESDTSGSGTLEPEHAAATESPCNEKGSMPTCQMQIQRCSEKTCNENKLQKSKLPLKIFSTGFTTVGKKGLF